MRAVLCLAVAGAAMAATNEIQATNAAWYSDSSNWSLTRFPRHDDVVVVSATGVTIGTETKPSTYTGATEGNVITITGSADLTITGSSSILTIGLGPAPVDCEIGTMSLWSDCDADCDGGTRSRSRTNVQNSLGGDACPDPATNIESQVCNTQPCGCASGKSHGDVYSGFGKDYCKQCKCHNGVDTCDDRECNVHASAGLCDKTTCEYGALFHDSDEFVTFDVAAAERGNNWQTTQDFELSTLVKHDETDSNGSIFHCGHVRDTTDTCKCYCANSGDHHIWHHAERHAQSIALGKTSAGCDCAADWIIPGVSGSAPRGPFNGCQNPNTAGKPASYGGEKHSDWCVIVAGSCPTDTNAVPAGVDAATQWDTCESHATYKFAIPDSNL